MNPISTALCSFGMSGQLFHAPFLEANPKFQLYGVLERHKNLAKDYYPHVHTFRSLDELLQDEAVELVILNTPNITHYAMAKEILLSGKHVVVEKPFTTTVEEADELIALAREKQLVLSVFHNRRWDSDFLTVQSVIEEGKLGPIVDVELRYDRYEPNLSYKIHKETPSHGVGSLFDLGSHLIDQALLLFGMPHSVYGHLSAFREHSEVVDYFDIKMYYESHSVTLKSSYFVCDLLPAYTLYGKKGSFIKNRADIQEAKLKEGKIPSGPDWGKEQVSDYGLLTFMEHGALKTQVISSLTGNYNAYYNSIYDAIRTNAIVPVTAEEGRAVIQIIEAVIKSNMQRKVVDL